MQGCREAACAAWGHVVAAGVELRQSVESMMPPEVGRHGRAAQKEILLAVRSLIDAAIERVDPPTSSAAPAGQ
jgi:hypothetical protein